MSLCEKLGKLKGWCGGKDEELEKLRKENEKLKEDKAVLVGLVEGLENKIKELLGELAGTDANLVDFHESDEFADQWMQEEGIE